MLLGGAAGQAAGATAPNPTIFTIDNGMNKVTVGKHKIMVLHAHRENFNAHSFEVVSFYETGNQLNLIPLFSKGKDKDKGEENEEFSLTVGGGADCLLHDFRFVKPDGKQPARLIVAERDLGESYADEETVHFTYYDLVDNPDEDAMGKPALYFQAKKKTRSRQHYCDVNEAFDKELHLGASGSAKQ